MTDEPHAEDRILAALDDMQDGLTVKQIQAITGLSRRYLTQVCGQLAERRAISVGRLMGVGSTTMLLICRPEHRATMMARVAEDKAMRAAKAKERKRAANLRNAERQPSYAAAQAWADEKPTQRLIPAQLANPLVKLGPSSVWELAL